LREGETRKRETQMNSNTMTIKEATVKRLIMAVMVTLAILVSCQALYAGNAPSFTTFSKARSYLAATSVGNCARFGDHS
jgi:hypothetical protein